MDLNLPQLAVGSHERNSGYACVMNALSYLKGDKVITDYPDCVDPFLARTAQLLNDKICKHLAERSADSGETLAQVLCSACAHQVWLFGAEIMGTGSHWAEGYEPESRALFEAQFRAWTDVYFSAMLNSGKLSSGAAKALLLRAQQLVRTRDSGAGVMAYLDLVNTALTLDHISGKQATHLKSIIYDGLLPFLNITRTSSGFAMKTSPQVMQEVASALTGSLYVMINPGRSQLERWATGLVRRWRSSTGFKGEPMILTPERAAQIHEAMAATPVMTGVYETV